VRIDRAPAVGGDVRLGPCLAGCGLLELLRLIFSPF